MFKYRMRLEIPKFTRCCGCLPLRHGIIVLGYLSMAFAIFFIALEVSFDHQSFTTPSSAVYRGAGFVAERWFSLLLYCIEIAFIVLLLVGAHTKRRKLLRIYYYYGITTCLAAVAVYLLVTLKVESHWSFYLMDSCIIFSGLVTQVYLLLLIRSELQKPTEDVSYVNHLAEVAVQPRNGINLL